MFKLTPLPYDYSALAPYISKETVYYHHQKHQAGYVKKLNDLYKGNKSLEELVINGQGKIQELASQIYNHEFYWKCMKVNGGGEPSQACREKLEESFGSVQGALDKLVEMATNDFGSSWVWLVKDGTKIAADLTKDAAPILTDDNRKPLFVIDLWEHSFIREYINDKEKYMRAIFNNLIDWEFVENNW